MSNTRNEVKQLAQHIEQLAKQVQANLDQGKDIFGLANELARNSSTFVFTLGALWILENNSSSAGTSKVKATTVSNPNKTATHKYHNVRDASGRFVRV